MSCSYKERETVLHDFPTMLDSTNTSSRLARLRSSPTAQDSFGINRPSEPAAHDPYTFAEEVVYVYLVPSVSAVGIVGNLSMVALLVFSRRMPDVASMRRPKRRFSGFMYDYVKGMAVLDTLYLIFSIQVRHNNLLSGHQRCILLLITGIHPDCGPRFERHNPGCG